MLALCRNKAAMPEFEWVSQVSNARPGPPTQHSSAPFPSSDSLVRWGTLVAYANFAAGYALEVSEDYAEAEGFVLGGGRSSRMGRDKALLQLGGRSMLEIALDTLRVLPLPGPPRVAGARSDPG